jgi:hypothetical protein
MGRFPAPLKKGKSKNDTTNGYDGQDGDLLKPPPRNGSSNKKLGSLVMMPLSKKKKGRKKLAEQEGYSCGDSEVVGGGYHMFQIDNDEPEPSPPTCIGVEESAHTNTSLAGCYNNDGNRDMTRNQMYGIKAGSVSAATSKQLTRKTVPVLPIIKIKHIANITNKNMNKPCECDSTSDSNAGATAADTFDDESDNAPQHNIVLSVSMNTNEMDIVAASPSLASERSSLSLSTRNTGSVHSLELEGDMIGDLDLRNYGDDDHPALTASISSHYAHTADNSPPAQQQQEQPYLQLDPAQAAAMAHDDIVVEDNSVNAEASGVEDDEKKEEIEHDNPSNGQEHELPVAVVASSVASSSSMEDNNVNAEAETSGVDDDEKKEEIEHDNPSNGQEHELPVAVVASSVASSSSMEDNNVNAEAEASGVNDDEKKEEIEHDNPSNGQEHVLPVAVVASSVASISMEDNNNVNAGASGVDDDETKEEIEHDNPSNGQEHVLPVAVVAASVASSSMEDNNVNAEASGVEDDETKEEIEHDNPSNRQEHKLPVAVVAASVASSSMEDNNVNAEASGVDNDEKKEEIERENPSNRQEHALPVAVVAASVASSSNGGEDEDMPPSSPALRRNSTSSAHSHSEAQTPTQPLPTPVPEQQGKLLQEAQSSPRRSSRASSHSAEEGSTDEKRESSRRAKVSTTSSSYPRRLSRNSRHGSPVSPAAAASEAAVAALDVDTDSDAVPRFIDVLPTEYHVDPLHEVVPVSTAVAAEVAVATSAERHPVAPAAAADIASNSDNETNVWKLIHLLNSDPANKICADCRTPLLEMSRMFCSFRAHNHVPGVGFVGGISGSSPPLSKKSSRPTSRECHVLSSMGSPTSTIMSDALSPRSHLLGESPYASANKAMSAKRPPSVQTTFSSPPKPPELQRKVSSTSDFARSSSALDLARSSSTPSKQKILSKSQSVSPRRSVGQRQYRTTTHIMNPREASMVYLPSSPDTGAWSPANSVTLPPMHGVFICDQCSQAHLQLSLGIATVASIPSLISGDGWTSEDVAIMATAGGNSKSNACLEHNVPEAWRSRIPSRDSTEEERLLFVKAKYEALAFVYIQTNVSRDMERSPWNTLLSKNAIHNVLEGKSPGSSSKAAAQYQKNATNTSLSMAPLPNRLLDYFCVMGPTPTTSTDKTHQQSSFKLDPSIAQKARAILTSAIVNGVTGGGALALETLELQTSVLEQYPASRPNMEFPSQIAKFVFPNGCTPTTTEKSPHYFHFVLTSETGLRLYGTALIVYDASIRTADLVRTLLMADKEVSSNEEEEGEMDNPRSMAYDTILQSDYCKNRPLLFLPKALVLLSHYPFLQANLQALKNLYHISLVEAPLPLERYVANLVEEVPLPPKGRVRVRYALSPSLPAVVYERPPMNDLPLANISYKPLFETLSVSNILVVFGLLLEETPVVLCSTKSLSLLTHAAEALASFLFPLVWQGIYIPVLPRDMLDVLQAPVPFLVGAHGDYLKDVAPEWRPTGVVFCDLDADVVHLGSLADPSTGDLYGRQTPALPEKQVLKLKHKLEEVVAYHKCYLDTPSGTEGSLTHGYGTPMPNDAREPYAYDLSLDASSNGVSPENSSHGILAAGGASIGTFISSRKQTTENHGSSSLSRNPRLVSLTQMDVAFKADEHLYPVPGFLGDLGSNMEIESIPSGGSVYGRGEKKNSQNKLKMKLAMSSGNGQSHSDSGTTFGGGGGVGAAAATASVQDTFPARELRAAFLRFFVSTLRDYEQNLRSLDHPKGPFDTAGFLKDSTHLTPPCRAFVETMVSSQMFLKFVEERLLNPSQHEILLFDESIAAKQNRSKANKLVGKKITTPFLLDDSQKIKDMFAPPHPSNWGLPDDGRFYRYTSGFPLQLDPALLPTKIRPPNPWVVEIATSTQPTVTTINLQTVQRLIFNPVFMQTSLFGGGVGLNGQTENGPVGHPNHDIVWAIHVVAYVQQQKQQRENEKFKKLPPNFPVKKNISSTLVKHKSADESHAALVAKTSELFGKAMLPVARSILESARREQSRPMKRIVKLQACVRKYLCCIKYENTRKLCVRLQQVFRNVVLHKKYGSRFSYLHYYAQDIQRVRRGYLARVEIRRLIQSAIHIQSVVRMHRLKKYVTLLINWSTTMQSLYRGRRTRFAYECVVDVVSTMQACVRGWFTRRVFGDFVLKRMISYRRQIVELWERAQRPLIYRTKFWRQVQDGRSFLHLTLHQDELVQLWTYLGLKPLDLVSSDASAANTALFSRRQLSSKLNPVTLAKSSRRLGMNTLEEELHGRLGARAQAIHKRFVIVQRKLDKVRRQGAGASTELTNLEPVFPSELNSVGNEGLGPLATPSNQLMIERAELYEKLKYCTRPDTLNRIFAAFYLPAQAKHKKERVASMIWRYPEFIEASCKTVLLQEYMPDSYKRSNKTRDRLGVGLQQYKETVHKSLAIQSDQWIPAKSEDRLGQNVVIQALVTALQHQLESKHLDKAKMRQREAILDGMRVRRPWAEQRAHIIHVYLQCERFSDRNVIYVLQHQQQQQPRQEQSERRKPLSRR